MSGNRLRDIPVYTFIYEYADESIQFDGVERIGIHKNGVHSLRTSTASGIEEHEIQTGWITLIVKPYPLLPEAKKGCRVKTDLTNKWQIK